MEDTPIIKTYMWRRNTILVHNIPTPKNVHKVSVSSGQPFTFPLLFVLSCRLISMILVLSKCTEQFLFSRF